MNREDNLICVCKIEMFGIISLTGCIYLFIFFFCRSFILSLLNLESLINAFCLLHSKNFFGTLIFIFDLNHHVFDDFYNVTSIFVLLTCII